MVEQTPISHLESIYREMIDPHQSQKNQMDIILLTVLALLYVILIASILKDAMLLAIEIVCNPMLVFKTLVKTFFVIVCSIIYLLLLLSYPQITIYSTVLISIVRQWTKIKRLHRRIRRYAIQVYYWMKNWNLKLSYLQSDFKDFMARPNTPSNPSKLRWLYRGYCKRRGRGSRSRAKAGSSKPDHDDHW